MENEQFAHWMSYDYLMRTRDKSELAFMYMDLVGAHRKLLGEELQQTDAPDDGEFRGR